MRIALGVEYDGSRYRGWQRQEHVSSVQEQLEQALSTVAACPIVVQCAGRTDAGVHATGQVVHFESENTRSDSAWVMGTNAHLPDDIAVRWATRVDDTFHARFSATARRYRYVIFNHPVRSGIARWNVSHYHQWLDAEKMHIAAQALLGENDFTSFRAAQCQSNTPFRDVHHIRVQRVNDYIVVDIQANAFLHHMVRNIVGTLLLVGTGEQPLEWVTAVLQAKDRRCAGATAKPHGLYLVDVTYPEFDLPQVRLGPLWLPE